MMRMLAAHGTMAARVTVSQIGRQRLLSPMLDVGLATQSGSELRLELGLGLGL